MKTCSIDGCERKHKAHGYCQLHFRRLKKHGDPLYIYSFKQKTCKIDGCDNNQLSKGYCRKHYKKYLKYGDPLFCKLEMHNMSHYPEYGIRHGMKDRCFNKNDPSYHRYGGRGITVCDEWKNSFQAFYDDMGKRPTPKHQIDRIDNNGNYEPSNCRWVTPAQNMRNRPATKLTMEKAREIRKLYKIGDISQSKLSIKFGVSRDVISEIIKNNSWKEEN